MEATIVPKSSFGNGTLLRLDAEYVKGSEIAVEAAIRQFGSALLSEITAPYDGPRLDGYFANEDDLIDYVDIDAVDTGDGLTYADKVQYGERPSRAKYELRVADILVSNVRPERGVASLVSNRLAGCVASSGFTLLRQDPSVILPQEYVYAFLRTKYGRDQLVRRARGSMYPAVLGRDVHDIVVPVASASIADRTKAAVRKALSEQERFFELLSDAEHMIEEFLAAYGPPPGMYYGEHGELTCTTVSRSRMFGSDSANRIDAEFFRAQYDDFAGKIMSAGPYFSLGAYYTLGAGRLSNAETTFVPTIKQAVLTNTGVNWSAVVDEPGECRGASVQEDYILLAATAHEIQYVGKKVDYVRSVPDDFGSCNQAVADLIIMAPKESKPLELPGSYVASFLRHDAGRHQVQRCIRGLRGGHVYASDLAEQVIVPIPPAEWSEKFEHLSREAEDARNRAKETIDSCVSYVEDWVRSVVCT